MSQQNSYVTRRTALRLGLLTAVPALAGCLGDDDDPTDENDRSDDSDDEPVDTDTPVDDPADDTPEETPADPTDDDADDTADDDSDANEPHRFEVETVADGFDQPWGLEFLPDDSRMLVTELPGTLSLLDREEGTVEELSGTPEVFDPGQGGLLDVTIHPDFPDESWVYLTYSVVDDEEDSTTALGRGRLDIEGGALEEFEELYAVEPFVYSASHYGSRVIFGEDGMVYVTVGDRQFKNFDEDHVSQDTTNAIGTTLRLEPDGSVPDDNPFVDDDDVIDEIYTYGHRNAQGMTVHPDTGDIWQSEHGEEDGDEINIIYGGENYGWPVTHTGCEYGTDDPVGEDPFERDDIVDPVYYWECNTGGFPPAGATFYDGEAFPNWQGDLFVGNLAGAYLGRFTVEDPASDDVTVEEVDPLLEDEGWRIRDVAVAPDTGYLYVAIDEDDAPIVRLVPE